MTMSEVKGENRWQSLRSKATHNHLINICLVRRLTLDRDVFHYRGQWSCWGNLGSTRDQFPKKFPTLIVKLLNLLKRTPDPKVLLYFICRLWYIHIILQVLQWFKYYTIWVLQRSSVTIVKTNASYLWPGTLNLITWFSFMSSGSIAPSESG